MVLIGVIADEGIDPSSARQRFSLSDGGFANFGSEIVTRLFQQPYYADEMKCEASFLLHLRSRAHRSKISTT